MKFTVNTQELKTAMGIVSKNISAKSNLPILCNVKLQQNINGDIILTGASQENTLSVVCPMGDVEDWRDICIDAALLNSALSTLGNQRVSVEVKGSEAVITYATGHFSFAVYEAVIKNKPLFERIVTVTGKSVEKPSNFLTRMGTPMSQLIDAAGGLPEDTGKVIGGGPMMGKALLNIEVPICKGSSGVLIMNDKEAARASENPCIRCAKCVSVCPMGLEPFLLATLSAKKDWERVEKEDVMSCIECGSCQFTCPSHRYLLDYIRLGKGTVGGIIRARNAKK